MSQILKILLCVLSISVLGFSYWFYFTESGQTWRIKNQIANTKTNPQSWERPEDLKDDNVIEDAPQTRMFSSSRNPIALENQRNYVTGDTITFIVPKDMRRMELQIQDHLGRIIQKYELPNWAITIKPGQRIRLKVKK